MMVSPTALSGFLLVWSSINFSNQATARYTNATVINNSTGSSPTTSLVQTATDSTSTEILASTTAQSIAISSSTELTGSLTSYTSGYLTTSTTPLNNDTFLLTSTLMTPAPISDGTSNALTRGTPTVTTFPSVVSSNASYVHTTSNGTAATPISSDPLEPSSSSAGSSSMIVPNSSTSTNGSLMATSDGTSTVATSGASATTTSPLEGSANGTSVLATGNGTAATVTTLPSLVSSSSSAPSSSITAAKYSTSALIGTGIIPSPIGITVVNGATESLFTTVATDSAGLSYTGTITEGPSTTPTPPITGLVTYTTFPTGVSWSSTSATANGHDSSGRPILGGWPLCWFCPPNIGGLVLFNFPGPGFYPGGWTLPEFPDPFPPLTIGLNGDPEYPSSPEPTDPSSPDFSDPPSPDPTSPSSPDPTNPSSSNPTSPTTSASTTSSSESCTQTETATDITYYVSYVIDTASSTISTATYSTVSSQITGCSVTGTVATSATATGSSYPWCQAGSCATCNANRNFPRATASSTGLEAPSQSASVFDVVRNITQRALENGMLLERDIPDYFSGFAELYATIDGAENTLTVPLDQAPIAGSVAEEGISSSRFTYFDNAEHNILVQELSGCTSVIVVSRLGAYATHFWEGPDFKNHPPAATDVFQPGVLDYMSNGRAGGESDTQILQELVQGGVFAAKYEPQVFIMSPATMDLDLKVTAPASLTQGDNPSLYGDGPDALINRLDPLQSYLLNLMPSVPISTFVYQRQTAPNLLAGPYGRATVLYSNKQVYDPDDADFTEDPLPAPQKAVWQCWMQGKKMGSDLWDALPGQTCASNQKRQDGSACALPTSASASGSATPITSAGSSSSIDVGSIIISGLGPSNASSIPTSTSTDASLTSIASILATTTSALPSSGFSTVVSSSGSTGNSSTFTSIGTTSTSAFATMTLASVSSAPPITSCTLSIASAATLAGVTLSASPVCSCNGGVAARLNTLTLSDGSQNLYCALGTATTIVVSTVPAPPPSTTTPPPATSTMLAIPPPSSAAPGEIILLSDLNCQNFLERGDYDHYSEGCWSFESPVINSYIVGTTDGCGCASTSRYCSWETFVITGDSGCGYDAEVGGGCSGAGSRTPTSCNPTTGPAQYLTAEFTSGGFCKRDAGNDTSIAADELEPRGFELEARAAGRITPRC